MDDNMMTELKPFEECPECGLIADADGDTEYCCGYAPSCDHCGGATCDQSC